MSPSITFSFSLLVERTIGHYIDIHICMYIYSRSRYLHSILDSSIKPMKSSDLILKTRIMGIGMRTREPELVSIQPPFLVLVRGTKDN
jgi:hypothetical protein